MLTHRQCLFHISAAMLTLYILVDTSPSVIILKVDRSILALPLNQSASRAAVSIKSDKLQTDIELECLCH